jgi:hypothetical protein
MNSTISSNSNRASYRGGGGVANLGGSLTVLNSTISDNYSYRGRGGGVANFDGSLMLLNSTISRNSIYGPYGEAAYGGGVANFGGSVAVLNSAISTNVSIGFYAGRADGGGLANLSGGSLTVLNSTISGNSSLVGCEFACGGSYGGAVGNRDGTVTLMNTTITGNLTASGRGNVANHGTLNLIDTLIAGDVLGIEISNYGTVAADNHNLIGVNGNSGVSGFTPGATDIVPPAGVQLADILDPALADNGGPTQTHALVPGSPAIDAGGDCTDTSGAPLTTDQRGRPRPVDGNGDGIRACDIGAVEVQAVPITIDIKPGSVPILSIPIAKE